MASQYQCKAELPITDIGEAETEHIARGSYFGDIHDIFIGEIKEEATEIKSISEYGVANECPKNNENGEFYDYSKFEVMLRDSIEDPTDSKIFPAIPDESKFFSVKEKNFWGNGNFNGLADELAKQKVNHFDNGVILKNEGNDDSLTNNVDFKMKALKNEDDIDIIYEDVKPEICEEKASEKGSYLNSVPDKSIGTTFSHELSKGFDKWPQQNIEEDGTAVERENDTRKESHQCKVCSKWFDRKWDLTRHERIHSGEKPFQCKICSKSFTSDNLKRHERVHTGEKPFQCKICLKSFTLQWDLTKHERIHTGEKPFQCKICLKSFNQKCTLLKHERGLHTGKRPFQCKFCQKRFAQKRQLFFHERIHTREKTFQCKLCPKCFADKSKLLRHERIHTGEKPYQCKICLNCFAEKSKLLRHERIHTGE